MSADAKEKAMQEHNEAQKKKKRKKLITAILSFVSIVALILLAFWAFSGWVGDFLGVDEANRPSLAEFAHESSDDLAASDAVYRAIFEDYSQRMEAEQPTLSREAFSLLAEEGVEQMSLHFLTTSQSGEEEEVYQQWATKVLDLYMELTHQYELLP
ncbi:MAG: hypothetical protein FWC86_05250 [Coriobacteriia bacterium]|nr:hypothetical protein [Coriobacteriia bacterium]